MGIEQAKPPFPLAGELASLCAAVLWAISIAIYTHYAAGLSSRRLSLYKNVVSTTCALIALAIIRPALPTDGMVWIMLILSGISGLAIGDTAFFVALPRLGAQASTAIQSLVPPFAGLIAFAFLHEKLTGIQWLGIGLTVAAVTGVMYFHNSRPDARTTIRRGGIAIGIVLAVVSALGQATGVVLSRQALQGIHVLLGMVIRMAPAIVLLGAAAFGIPTQPGRERFASTKHMVAITFACFIGAFVGLLLATVGVKYTKAGIATALSSTFPIWTIPIAAIFLKERVRWTAAACTMLAVGGIVLMFVTH